MHIVTCLVIYKCMEEKEEKSKFRIICVKMPKWLAWMFRRKADKKDEEEG